MSAADPGEVFLDNHITGQDYYHDLSDNDDADVNSHFDDDASQFSTQTINSVDAKDIYGIHDAPPDDEMPSEPANECNENHDYSSESVAETSKIRKDNNSAPEDTTGHENDHLPSESAGETHQTTPVDDPASEDSGIDFASSETHKTHPSSNLDTDSNSRIDPVSSESITEINQINPNTMYLWKLGGTFLLNQLGQQWMDGCYLPESNQPPSFLP